MRSRIDDAEIRGAILRQGNRLGVTAVTITGNYAVPVESANVLIINNGGSARNVTLPASPKKGTFFFIINAGAAILTVQDSAAGALSPACTPTTAEIAIVIWDGTKWWNMVGLGA